MKEEQRCTRPPQTLPLCPFSHPGTCSFSIIYPDGSCTRSPPSSIRPAPLHITREPHEQPQNQFPHHAIGQKQFPFTEDEAQVRRERFTTYVRCPGPDMLLLFLISYGVCVRNIHVSAQLCARSGKTERNSSRGKWISAFIALFLFTFFEHGV